MFSVPAHSLILNHINSMPLGYAATCALVLTQEQESGTRRLEQTPGV